MQRVPPKEIAIVDVKKAMSKVPIVKLIRLEDQGFMRPVASDSDIKKEIEDFLDAPMDIDNSQYEMAVKAELFGEAYDSKMTTVDMEEDRASDCNALTKCRETSECGSTMMIKKEEVCGKKLH
ncbi:hypothetical protein LSTR_LSTR015524 [Laodelphax striatellus]|uniref:Uncharacterized protein n=1 Tax=Laodelphax striatellus TaxID=195883 RepID=A0A482XLJ5_LAOST|nr:hypothetical protein LSTR_LSTR015524 [Laodelphax striatellus]